MISVFDLFKIGIGPSSSHTMGPMIAAARFRDLVGSSLPNCVSLDVTLYGSLAWAYRGHGSEQALCLGLMGKTPDNIDPDEIEALMARVSATRTITLADGRAVHFDPLSSILLEKTEILPRHSNAMRFHAFDEAGTLLADRVFYSIGGGFVIADEDDPDTPDTVALPYPFCRMKDLLALAKTTGLAIADIQFANELTLRSDEAIRDGLDAIWQAMSDSIDRGMSLEGELPGGLKVKRRALSIRQQLLDAPQSNTAPPHEKLDWVSTYALAVNEENAGGGRIVTAPTNGAAGIVPAVLRYYREFYDGASDAGTRTFLLTAAAIGAVIKANASISGAEVGCQGEVGSAAAMAAAGLAAVSGGTPAQVENAAEIALEHHLGMTCDPVGGLVQVPCIERNAIGAHKAIAAASLALRCDGVHRVSLDEVVETMRQTGLDMQDKYKETARGGLAVNVAEC